MIHETLFARTTGISNYPGIPEAIDWISMDRYALDSSAWTLLKADYELFIYPKMNPSQCALILGGAYGSDDGSHTMQWYDNFMHQAATEYYAWAQADRHIVGITMWYYKEFPGPFAPNFKPYDQAAETLPQTSAYYASIGRVIIGA